MPLRVVTANHKCACRQRDSPPSIAENTHLASLHRRSSARSGRDSRATMHRVITALLLAASHAAIIRPGDKYTLDLSKDSCTTIIVGKQCINQCRDAFC